MKRKFAILTAVLKAKLFRRFTPLVATISLTNRCNLDCLYCGVPSIKDYEMTTDEVLNIIKQLKKLGTQRVNITGGEPLLRRDFAEIMDDLHKKDILINVSSNGLLFKDKIPALKKAHNITVSLDALGDHNISARGISSAKVIAGIELCKSNQIPVSISTVLSKYNLKEIGSILEFSRTYDLVVGFQPSLKTSLIGGANPAAPDPLEYKDAVKTIMRYKKSGKYKIFNSHSGLKYLYHWPDSAYIPCWAGKLLCRIEPNGKMYPCSRVETKSANCLETGVERAFHQVYTESCHNCWCAGLVEFNLFASLNMDAVQNLLQLKR